MDHSYLFEILGDHPDNIKKINEALYDIKASLFKSLHNTQYGLTDVFQRVIDFSTYRAIDHTKIAFDIDYTFIDNAKRIKFKQSPYYKKELYSTDLYNVTDLFHRCIMVFINGKLTNNYYVFIDDAKLQIIFKRYYSPKKIYNDGLSAELINEYKNNHVNMCVVIMPLCERHNTTINLNTLYNNNYTLDIPTDNTPLVLMSSNGKTKEYFNTGITYSPMYVNDNQLINGTYQNVNADIEMTYLYPDNLLEVKDIDSDGWFSIELQKTPIPVENILVFKRLEFNSSKMELLYGDDIMTMYYPNIYKINIPSDMGYRVFVFYANDISDEKYKSELKLYTDFINAEPQYRDGSIPDYIKTYKPIEMVYDIDDYKAVSTGETELQYKIRKLREVIEENPDLYKYYMEKYTDLYPCVNHIVTEESFSNRVRRDTSQELPFTETFDEDRYLFSISTSYMGELSMFFIDNLYYYPDKVYVHNGYLYIYIPTELVHVDSYIHICKLYNNTFTKEYTIDTSVPTKVVIDKVYRAAGEDIYLTVGSGDNEKYITEGFSLCEKLSSKREILDKDIEFNGEYYRPIYDTSFHRYNELYIIFGDDTYNGQTITVRSDKRTLVFDSAVALGTLTINSNINTDKRNLLIYRDGRLMSSYAAKYRYSDNPNGPHEIQSLLIMNDDTVIKTIHSSEKYNLICDYNDENIKHLRVYQKYMDTPEEIYEREDNLYNKIIESSGELEAILNSKGKFVDLTNMITKPLDFRWYDIYLNGLRLTERDVTFVSPYQLIINIDDDYPDIDTFIVTDVIGFIEKYVIPLPFLNPDWQQVTEEMIEEYPEMMDPKLNVVFDGDKEYTTNSSILLDPDDSNGYTLEA